jgi:hypothetical protein
MFHEDPSNGSQVVPCELTDITQLTVDFRNFVNAPKNDPRKQKTISVYLYSSTNTFCKRDLNYMIKGVSYFLRH